MTLLNLHSLEPGDEIIIEDLPSSGKPTRFLYQGIANDPRWVFHFREIVECAVGEIRMIAIDRAGNVADFIGHTGGQSIWRQSTQYSLRKIKRAR